MKNNVKQSTFFKKEQIFNGVIVCLLVYFIFHSIYGHRGIIAYFQMQAELEIAHNELEQLRMHRLDIENRTKMLRPDSLDLDMLDEKVRSVLGLTKTKEKIFQPKLKK